MKPNATATISSKLWPHEAQSRDGSMKPNAAAAWVNKKTGSLYVKQPVFFLS